MAQNAITKYKVLALGGSAGSLEVILRVIAALPQSTHLSVIIIVHRKNDGESVLVDLLSTRTKLFVKEVEDKETINAATIYIAPPDYHLLIENEKMFSLDASEKVHHSRPSIDVTFECVAKVFGEAAIGVLLSGANADGAEGLSIIKKAGGYTIVQDPKSADVGFMPQQALDTMKPDIILSAENIADYIVQLLL